MHILIWESGRNEHYQNNGIHNSSFQGGKDSQCSYLQACRWEPYVAPQRWYPCTVHPRVNRMAFVPRVGCWTPRTSLTMIPAGIATNRGRCNQHLICKKTLSKLYFLFYRRDERISICNIVSTTRPTQDGSINWKPYRKYAAFVNINRKQFCYRW